MFESPEAREMFRFIESYSSNRNHYGRIPSARIMSKRFPAFTIAKNVETLPELCNALRRDRMKDDFYEGLTEAVMRLEADEEPESVLGTVRELAGKIAAYSPSVHERELHETAQEFWEWYENQEEKESVIGIPWPWDRLTEATQGIDDEDLYVIYGRPKSMKSFIACETAASAFLNHHSRALVYSCEMKSVRFERRLFAALARIDYSLMKRGELKTAPEQRERLRAIVEGMQTGEIRYNGSALKVVPMKDCPSGMDPLQHLAISIETWEPTIVFADSFYRMVPDRRWEKQANLVTGLKTMTQTYGAPIVAVTQGTRLKAKSNQGGDTTGEEHLEDIAFTDAIGQEADGIIRVRKHGRFKDGARLLKLSIAGSRESEEEGGSLFLRFRPFIQSDTDKWVNAGEDKEEDVGDARSKPTPKKKFEKEAKKLTKSARWKDTEDVTTPQDLGIGQQTLELNVADERPDISSVYSMDVDWEA